MFDDFFRKKNGKPYASRSHLRALKLVLNKVLDDAFASESATLGNVQTIKNETEFEQQHVNEVVQSFDKAWTKFYNDWTKYTNG